MNKDNFKINPIKMYTKLCEVMEDLLATKQKLNSSLEEGTKFILLFAKVLHTDGVRDLLPDELKQEINSFVIECAGK